MEQPTYRVRAALGVGILGISAAAILVRWLGGRDVPPLTVAGWRMLYAGALMVPIAWSSRARLARTVGRQPLRIVTASVLLAAHFGTYTASLYHLDVARAVLLVSTQPLFVVAAQLLLERERPSAGVLGGLTLALAGIVGMLAPGFTSVAFGRGEALALASAAFLALYIVQGRRVRRDVPVSHYNVPLYLLAGCALLVAARWRGEASLPWTWPVQGLLLALAVVPTLCGHSMFHWALRHVSSTVVSVAFLGEAVGAGLLAWVIFGEVPGGATLVGGVVCLVGVTGVVLAEERSKRGSRDA